MDYNKVIYNLVKNYENITERNFIELALAFEYYSAIILSNEYNKQIYHYNCLVLVYKEENNLSKRDTGIDLCDKIDIIGQVKLRSNTLNWKELSTFVAQINQYDSITKKRYIKWQEPILIRNSCSKLSPNLEEHLNFKICDDKPLKLKDFYDYCNNLKDNPPLYENTNDSIEIREYQTHSINLIKDNPNNNIYLCLPTGSGKTYVVIMSIEPNKKYLILVPFIILLEQWYKEIIKIRPELKPLIQCLGDGNNTFNSNKLITISTYNSVELAGNLQDYDRVITDEAHRIVKPQIYEEIEEEENTKYTTIINNNINENNNNILTSATLDEPDDDSLYYKVELRDLINQGILTDYQIKIPIFRDDANDISVCNYIVKNYSNMIIYSSSQKQGKEITETLNKISKNCAYYIDCNTPKKQRKDIIRDFRKGNIRFLVNVRILIEGFNVKRCKGVILYHISSNDKTIIQIIGRALRKHKDKLYAYVILPFINSDDSKTLQFILRVLANNDPEIKQRCINKKLGGYIDIEIPSNDNVEDNDNSEENDELLEAKFEIVFDSLANCIKGNIELWNDNLEKLKKFIDDNKTTPKQKSENIIEKKLGIWLSAQKWNFKNNLKIMKNNEDIKILWKNFIEEYKEYLLTNKEVWNYNLEKLKKFIDDNKRTPRENIKKDINENIEKENIKERKLGQWLHLQKMNFKNNLKIMKNNEDIKILWKNFIEEYKEYFMSNEEKWYFSLEKVKEYMKIHKVRPAEKSTDEAVRKLGVWLSNNIINYRNNNKSMKNLELKEAFKKFKDEYKI